MLNQSKFGEFLGRPHSDVVTPTNIGNYGRLLFQTAMWEDFACLLNKEPQMVSPIDEFETRYQQIPVHDWSVNVPRRNSSVVVQACVLVGSYIPEGLVTKLYSIVPVDSEADNSHCQSMEQLSNQMRKKR